MPAAAILIALLLSDELFAAQKSAIDRPTEGLPIASWLNFGFVAVVGIVIASSYRWIQVIEDPAMPEFPLALRESGVLFWGAALCAEVAIAIYLLIRRRQTRWLWSVNLIGFVAILLFVLAPTTVLMDQHRQAPLREISRTLVAQRQPNEELMMVAFEKPSVVFYTQMPMLFFRRSRSAFRHLQEFSLQQPQPETVLILTQPDWLERLGLVGGAHRSDETYQVLDEAGAYVLLRVPKQTFRDRFTQGVDP